MIWLIIPDDHNCILSGNYLPEMNKVLSTTFTTLLSFGLVLPGFAQTLGSGMLDFRLADHHVSEGYSTIAKGCKLIVDPDAIYTVGNYRGTIELGDSVYDNTIPGSPQSQPYESTYVVSYDLNEQVLWSVEFPQGFSESEVSSNEDYIFIGGFIHFVSVTIGDSVVTLSGSPRNVVIICLDKVDGNIVWVVDDGEEFQTNIDAMTIDSNGDSYYVRRDSPIQPGPHTYSMRKVTATGEEFGEVFEIFSMTSIRDMKIDSQGNLYLVGSDGNGNGRFVKLSPTGQVIWETNCVPTGNGDAAGTSIFLDEASQTVYYIGYFGDSNGPNGLYGGSPSDYQFGAGSDWVSLHSEGNQNSAVIKCKMSDGLPIGDVLELTSINPIYISGIFTSQGFSYVYGNYFQWAALDNGFSTNALIASADVLRKSFVAVVESSSNLIMDFTSIGNLGSSVMLNCVDGSAENIYAFGSFGEDLELGDTIISEMNTWSWVNSSELGSNMLLSVEQISDSIPSLLVGKIFRDYDLDHEIDEGEPYVTGQVLRKTKDSGNLEFMNTDTTGLFYFVVEDTGTYEISYNPPDNFIESGGIESYLIQVAGDTIVNDLNFGIGSTDTIVDINVDLTSFFNQNVGASFNVWTSAYNTGNVTTAYNTAISTDGLTSITAFQQEDSILQPNQVLTDLISVSHNDESIAAVTVQVTSNTTLGTEVAINDNRDSVSVDIVLPPITCCSHDPNDKTISGTFCEASYVEIGDTLEYLIRFMNTGTAPATSVILIDTLDASFLDLRTFRAIGNSHEMTWEIGGPGILTVTHPNIYLPDSGQSFLGSQGFFKFRTLMLDTISNVTASGSSAFIYFDNELPVETNTPTIIAVDSIPVSQLSATDAICGGQFGEISAELSFALNIDSATWSTGYEGLPLLYNAEDVYSVELVDEYGCHYLDSVEVGCQLVTGILNPTSGMRIVPNPSKGLFQVNSYATIERYTLKNALGQIILTSDQLSTKTLTFDLSGFDKGLYPLELETDQGLSVGKVVVQ